MMKQPRLVRVLLAAFILAVLAACLPAAAGAWPTAGSAVLSNRMIPAVGTGETVRPGDGVMQFSTVQLGGQYYMVDTEALLIVYDMGGKALKSVIGFFAVKESADAADYYVVDAIGYELSLTIRGYRLLKNNREEAGHSYELSRDGSTVYDNGEVLFRDPVRMYIPGKQSMLRSWLRGKNDVLTNKRYDLMLPVSDKDNRWDNKQAAAAIVSLKETWTFWKEVLGRNGFDDTGKGFIVIFANTVVSGNASAYAELMDLAGFFCRIKIDRRCNCSLDTLAHEYNHAVFKTFTKYNDTAYLVPQFSAIDEGLSDIMAECCGAYINGECDWVHGKGRNLRDMKDPAAGHKPDRFGGNYWVTECVEGKKTLTDDEWDLNSIYAHDNSTVISHMGYMIATGEIEGAVNHEPLGTDKLARLIYATYPSVFPTMTMNDYARILYDTAVRMYRDGDLTSGQVRCVYEAIYRAGLRLEYILPDAKLSRFMDLDGTMLAGYLYDVYRIIPTVGDDTQFSGEVKAPVQADAPLSQDPAFGKSNRKYRIVLTNAEDPELTFVFYLEFNKRGTEREGIFAPMQGQARVLVRDVLVAYYYFGERQSTMGTLYEYNRAGQKIGMKRYDATFAEDTLSYRETYTYDELGRMTEKAGFSIPSDSDQPSLLVTYEYEGDSSLPVRETQTERGNTTVTAYTYDPEGNCTEAVTDPDGAGGYRTKTEYQYENGHTIHQCTYLSSGRKSEWSRRWEYDGKGNLIRDYTLYNEDLGGYIVDEKRYTYDDMNRPTELLSYRTSWDDDTGWKSVTEPFEPNYVTEYDYDENGNVHEVTYQILPKGERSLDEITVLEYGMDHLLVSKKHSLSFDPNRNAWVTESSWTYEYKLLSELFP